jgi:hypothetical protein
MDGLRSIAQAPQQKPQVVLHDEESSANSRYFMLADLALGRKQNQNKSEWCKTMETNPKDGSSCGQEANRGSCDPGRKLPRISRAQCVRLSDMSKNLDCQCVVLKQGRAVQ